MLIERPGITLKNLKMNNWKTIKEATTIYKFQGCQLAQKAGLKLQETKQTLGFVPGFHTRKLKVECFAYFSRTISNWIWCKIAFWFIIAFTLAGSQSRFISNFTISFRNTSDRESRVSLTFHQHNLDGWAGGLGAAVTALEGALTRRVRMTDGVPHLLSLL